MRLASGVRTMTCARMSASRSGKCTGSQSSLYTARGGPRNSHTAQPDILKNESFLAQVPKTAAGSPVEGTIACPTTWLVASPRKHTQEADGSIPFSYVLTGPELNASRAQGAP